jgi:hypothetical protein
MTDMFGPDDPYDDGSSDDAPLSSNQWMDFWLESQSGEPPEWWDDTVTLYNDYFQPVGLTGEDWFNETLLSKEELMSVYGMDNLDIIHQLEDMGLWDAETWDEWRELYG